MKVEINVFVQEVICVGDKLANFAEQLVKKVGGFVKQLKISMHSNIVEWLSAANKTCGAPNNLPVSITKPLMMANLVVIRGFILA